MQVTNRHGIKEAVSFDKITTRIQALASMEEVLSRVDPTMIAAETIKSMYDGISTKLLDSLSADICASKAYLNPDYNQLGGRILMGNIVKETSDSLLAGVTLLREAGLLSNDFYTFCATYETQLQSFIDYSRDFLFDYFAVKTLDKSYLLKINDKIIERPQHMWIRVAIQLHGCHPSADTNPAVALQRIHESYDLLSRLFFVHATPTLYNAGSTKPQASSCFLMSCEDDITSIFKMIGDIAQISKYAGGIGISVSNIRAKGSLIRSNHGRSDGILPLLKTLEAAVRYINQRSKRAGSLAAYLEPWHADVYSFVELRKNTGDENLRARDLFLALWVPDIFMRRVQENGDWPLFCPDECPGLVNSFGDQFEQLFLQYEAAQKYKRVVKATDLWNHILENQIETGMPYISYKDTVNRRNMQAQLGVIRNSNLCNEICLYSDTNNYAVCNLSSICLPRFVEWPQGKDQPSVFNFEKLRYVSGVITRNLDNLIDVNYYPVPEARVTNMANRPIGIGVQGLADVYCLMRHPFASPEAVALNRLIFENIYYGSVAMSIQLAKERGPYASIAGSPHSQGKLQFHLCDAPVELTLDWDPVIDALKQHGIRNSLLTALMPTASTSQIMCNNEAFEPFTSNIYVRKTLAGEFTVVNKYLVQDLLRLNLWTKEIYEEILYDNGSIQLCQDIPNDIKVLYRTAFDGIRMRDILDQAIGRSPFVDHTQSMNIFQKKVDLNALNSSHFYGWKNGLKTGMYYLRSMPASDAAKFGLDAELVKRIRQRRKEAVESNYKERGVCPSVPELRELCESCSS